MENNVRRIADALERIAEALDWIKGSMQDKQNIEEWREERKHRERQVFGDR